MELNHTYNAFLALLRAGLWNREPDGEYFPLSPEVWKQVYQLAHKQTVQGIIYEGIMLLPDNYFPPKKILLKWVVSVDSIEKRNEQMNKDAGELYAFFKENHITAFLMKGQGIASCYENPLLRVCGDIDWFFPDKEQFDRANRLIEECGIKIQKQIGFGSTCYIWREFLIEHHQHLLDIRNPFLSGYLCRLRQKEYDNSVYLNINGQTIPILSPLLTHLSVNTHILKHLLSFGITIRQVCDSARVCYAYHDQVSGDALKEIYSKLGIYNWMQQLNHLLVSHFGMPEKYLPFPLTPQRKADEMMTDLLQGIDFGYYIDSRSGGVKRKFILFSLLARFSRYVRCAPWETCWFPVIHIYSRIKNWVIR
jgi:hypothetical protein